MAIAISYTANNFTPGNDTTFQTQIVRGKLTFSGSYVTGGDTLNFSTHPVGVASPVATNQRPIGVNFWEEPASGTVISGVAALMQYRNVAAKPNASNGVVQIISGATFSGSTVTAATEYSAGAYSSVITGAVILFEAIFVLGR
jgi:hypothetical protein